MKKISTQQRSSTQHKAADDTLADIIKNNANTKQGQNPIINGVPDKTAIVAVNNPQVMVLLLSYKRDRSISVRTFDKSKKTFREYDIQRELFEYIQAYGNQALYL